MDKNSNQAIQAVRNLTPISTESQRAFLENKKNETSISIYQDQPVSKEDFAQATAMLKSNFPKMDDAFYVSLGLMVKDEEMTSERFKEAVKRVIKTHHYPEIKIADILDYDVRIRKYTPNEIYNACGEFPHPNFCKVRIGNSDVFCLRREAEELKLDIIKTYDYVDNKSF